MLPNHHWARNPVIEADDIEDLTNLLLEKETPLTSRDLAFALIERRLKREEEQLEARYKDTTVYDPAEAFKVGQKLVFPNLNYATANVTNVRPGENEAYGDFNVIAVAFDEAEDEAREFAAELKVPHNLTAQNGESQLSLLNPNQLSAETIFKAAGDEITDALEERLVETDEIVHVGKTWFPLDLILPADEGHLNLAEAVLDLARGGPLTAEVILGQIGGLGDTPMSLQVFSLNYALNQDSRFEEVGPAGEILWYLARVMPEQVRQKPVHLAYTPFDYDRDLLTTEMVQLEAEINDELTKAPTTPQSSSNNTVILTYPHRRSGTLPLTPGLKRVFPSARRARYVWVTLVDTQDDEEYTGWVVPKENYIYGLGPIYSKHKLPIGAFLSAVPTDEPDRFRIEFNAYRPRTEWIRLIVPQGTQITFENTKRAIGADYDDLMILGVDDLEALDKALIAINEQHKSLPAVLRLLIPALGKLTPQGTAHVRTIYSALNVVRRSPPGPILATLQGNPDFQDVGGHYWKLSET